ncbi:MAG TPA: hypothetical protein VF275_12060 [Gammaproteobacteria bacterium]
MGWSRKSQAQRGDFRAESEECRVRGESSERSERRLDRRVAERAHREGAGEGTRRAANWSAMVLVPFAETKGTRPSAVAQRRGGRNRLCLSRPSTVRDSAAGTEINFLLDSRLRGNDGLVELCQRLGEYFILRVRSERTKALSVFPSHATRLLSVLVRVIYYFHDASMPLYLLVVFGKNEKANLSKAERNSLSRAVKALVAFWRQRNGQSIH